MNTVNTGEHPVNTSHHQSKEEFLSRCNIGDIAMELIRRLERGEVGGNGLEGVRVEGGRLVMTFVKDIKDVIENRVN